MVQSGASLPRLRTNFPPPVSAEPHCRPNIPPGNITLLEVQIGKTGAQMEEVQLPQTSVRGHRPKERMPALVGESEEFLQFSAQRPFQTLASIPVMGRTELCLPHRSSPTLFQRVDPTRARMPPLKEEYEEFLQANTQRNLPEKGETTLQLVQDSLSATQKRNLLLSNYSNGQKVGV